MSVYREYRRFCIISKACLVLEYLRLSFRQAGFCEIVFRRFAGRVGICSAAFLAIFVRIAILLLGSFEKAHRVFDGLLCLVGLDAARSVRMARILRRARG
jgi:hypothetical protein